MQQIFQALNAYAHQQRKKRAQLILSSQHYLYNLIRKGFLAFTRNRNPYLKLLFARLKRNAEKLK